MAILLQKNRSNLSADETIVPTVSHRPFISPEFHKRFSHRINKGKPQKTKQNLFKHVLLI